MSKSVPDLVMDKILDEIALSTLMTVTSDVTTPVDLLSGLAESVMTGVDFTQAVGDAGAGSRKVTMAAQPGIAVTVGGTPLHVVLSQAGVIKLVTTCTAPTLTVGSTVDFPAWKYEIGAPV